MKKKYPEEEYPLYEIVIDDYDNTGIRLLSIVAEPAIEMMGMAFDSEQKTKEFEFKEVKDKQIIVGPAMIPDKKIMRKDDDGNPYMVVFSKETISQMVSKFNANGSNRRINVDHSKQMVNAFVMENWIVEDPYYDKARLHGFDVPIGTWMVCVKVEDDEFWKDEVRGSGKYGFSIEGLMGQKAYKMSQIEEFKIEKKPGETKNDFVGRCISHEIGKGHPHDQSIAMCISQWENYESVEMNSIIDGLSDDEILEMFNASAREEDESFVLEFMVSKGRKLSGTQKFVDEGDITIPQPQMYWTYVGPNDEKTRPFCKHMLELDKYWTDEDLNEMTDRLGYDFQQYFGSYNCRHKLQRVFISGKPDEPTKSEKKSLVSDQRESGLLGFMKEFTKRRECFGCPPSGDGKNLDGSTDQRCRGGKESGEGGKPPHLIPGTPESNRKKAKNITTADEKIVKKYNEDIDKAISDYNELSTGKSVDLGEESYQNVLDKLSWAHVPIDQPGTVTSRKKEIGKNEGSYYESNGYIHITNRYGENILSVSETPPHRAKMSTKRENRKGWDGEYMVKDMISPHEPMDSKNEDLIFDPFDENNPRHRLYK